MPPSTLDAHFEDLRQCVEAEIARTRRELIEEISKAVLRMRSSTDDATWSAAVMESGRPFAEDPAAIDLMSNLAVLTAPRAAARSGIDGSNDVLNNDAERFARVKIAEMQLFQAPAVKAGRALGDLYGMLKPQIDAARDAYKDRFLTSGQATGDYLHAELVRTLANDDANLLGPNYPGPLA